MIDWGVKNMKLAERAGYTIELWDYPVRTRRRQP